MLILHNGSGLSERLRLRAAFVLCSDVEAIYNGRKEIFMKKAGIITVILLTAGLLGCGNATADPAGSSGAMASETANGGSGTGKVQVEFLQGKPEGVDAYEEVIRLFEQENDEIDVEQVNLPDTYTVLTTRLSSEEYPDLFNHFPLRPDFEVLAQSGQVLELTGDGYLKHVNPSILEMSKTEEGKVYALPLTINTMGLYINKELLDAYGLSVPSTYEELIAMLETAADKENGRFLFACKDTWTLWQMMDRLLGQLYMNSGNDFAADFAAIGRGDKKAEDIPEIVRAAQQMLELFSFSQEDPFGTSFPQMCDDFANGRGIAFFQGTWAYPNIKKVNPDLDFIFVPLPAEEGQKAYLSMNIDIGLCIPEGSKNIDGAKKFLAFISTPENAQVFNDADGSMSCITGVKNNIAEFTDAYRMIDQGDVYEMMSNMWPVNYNTTLMDYISAMLLNRDLEGYLKDVDMITPDFYQ